MIYQQTELHNCYDIVEDVETGGRKMIRIPEQVRKNMSLIGRKYTAYNTPNAEIRFCMKSEEVKLHFQIFHPEGGYYADQALEVYFGCFQNENLRILDDQNDMVYIRKPENMELLKKLAIEEGHPFSPEVVRVIAPGDCHLMLKSVEGEIEPPTGKLQPARRWLAYGSSITQGSNGLHPSGAYASIAAARLKVDLINLGFGGSALLEPEMADYLAERDDFDFISLEMGVNMTWNIEENCPGDPEFFRKRVDYFVSRIADAHPDKWIFCLDQFRNKDDYTGEGQTALYRQIVKEKVASLSRKKVVYLDCTSYLDSSDCLCTDLLHPSTKGCAKIGNKLAEVMGSYLEQEAQEERK